MLQNTPLNLLTLVSCILLEKKSGSGKDLTQTSRGKGDAPLKVKILMKEQE